MEQSEGTIGRAHATLCFADRPAVSARLACLCVDLERVALSGRPVRIRGRSEADSRNGDRAESRVLYVLENAGPDLIGELGTLTQRVAMTCLMGR